MAKITIASCGNGGGLVVGVWCMERKVAAWFESHCGL
jgi:hypothetical protein